MRSVLLLTAGLCLGLAAPSPAAAQAPPGAVFTPCGGRVVASGWESQSNGQGGFRSRVTLAATQMVHIRVSFRMQWATPDGMLPQGFDFWSGRSGVINLGTGPRSQGAAALQGGTILTCAPMVLD